MDLKKAKLLDKILLKFWGNKTLKWSDIQNGAWSDIAIYDDCEKNINFLVGDSMLKRDTTLHTLWTTDKGFATMTDLKNLGYVTKVKKERLDNGIKYLAFGLAIATFLILFYNNFIKPKLAEKPIPAPRSTEVAPKEDVQTTDSISKQPRDTVTNKSISPK
jgi:hypothetical protein